MSPSARRRLCLAVSTFLVLPVLAESRLEERRPLAPGGTFTLDTDSGAVTIRGTSARDAHIVVTSPKEGALDEFTFEYIEKPGGLEVRVRNKNSNERYGIFSWLMSGGRSQTIEFEIEVPRKTSIVIDTAGGPITAQDLDGDAVLDTSGGPISAMNIDGKVAADTSGGPIAIADVKGDVVADTSGGPIALERIQGDAVADTSGGPIRMDGVTGDLVADTSGGSIRITDAGGRVRADTSGGGADVAFARGNGKGGSISASGGGVRVALDPGVNLDIEASASGGSVSSDLDLGESVERSKNELRGRIGSGGSTLVLEASGGSVRIDSL
jgi:hypothetical protein